MARPKKVGLDYFPLDVHFDSKVLSFELLHGNDGFTWLIKFWQNAYQSEHGEVNLNGLFGDCSAKNSRITTEQQVLFLKTCKELDLLIEINPGVWTSDGIKKRISSVSQERSNAILRRLNPKKKKRKEKKSKVKETGSCSPNNYEQFLSFWESTNRKGSKQDASNRFEERLKKGATLDDIKNAYIQLKKEKEGSEFKFWPDISGFLNSYFDGYFERYKDPSLSTVTTIPKKQFKEYDQVERWKKEREEHPEDFIQIGEENPLRDILNKVGLKPPKKEE